MKNNFAYLVLGAFFALGVVAILAFKPASAPGSYEYKQFSTIESIVPGGLGRSRIISTDKGGQMVEKDLLNFYSMVGINFGNISNNDAAIVNKLNEWTDEGWELVEVTTGSSTNTSNGSTSGGIFITRYLFRRAK
ncbi:MAG: hypothetical protein LCH37_02570 [Bacteroidetes bacterium]|nr:hypothetical protein [Bacteroidota bacterium]MCK6611905.1 hypothetical protein [Bacteroidia bacterium]